jgi:hypothetical protein
MPDDIIPTLPFSYYVIQSLRVLRAAAAAGLNTSEEKDMNVRRAVCIFFLGSCFPKLKNRVTAFMSMHPRTELRQWPTEGTDLSVKTENVHISNNLVELTLKRVKLASVGISGRHHLYEFKTDTIRLWWMALIFLLESLEALVATPTTIGPKLAKVPETVVVSIAVHHLLSKLPAQLWKLNSLEKEKRAVPEGPSIPGELEGHSSCILPLSY